MEARAWTLVPFGSSQAPFVDRSGGHRPTARWMEIYPNILSSATPVSMLYSCIFTAFLVFSSLANAFHNVTYNDNDPAIVYNPASDWLVLLSPEAYILTYYIGLTGLRLAVYHGNRGSAP